MLDFGYSEMLFVMVLAVVLIGPKELPVVMRALGRVMRRLNYVRYAFSQQFEDFMREHDLDDLRNQVNFEQKHSGEGFDESAADEEDENIIEASPPVKVNDV
jgi:Tat protein translocase TatB subunit